MMRVLDVYLHTQLVGQLHQDKDAKLKFRYDDDYLNQNLPGISISLPPRAEVFDDSSLVKAFFLVSYLMKIKESG